MTALLKLGFSQKELGQKKFPKANQQTFPDF